MSNYLMGCDVLGAVGPKPRVPSVIKFPNSVIVTRRNYPKSDTWSEPRQIAVSGGSYWVPDWNPADNMWSGNPTKVVVTLRDGSMKVYTDAKEVTVRGGVRGDGIIRKTRLFGDAAVVYEEDRVLDEILGVIGADLPVVKTSRATTLYVSPDSNVGASVATGKSLYAWDEIKNGRRHVNLNLGGTDYWVPAGDVVSQFPSASSAPMLDIEKKVPVIITEKPGAAGTVSSWVEKIMPQYVIEKLEPKVETPSGSMKVVWPLLLAAGIGVLGLGATIYLLAKAKWGWALANFFLLTPLVAAGVGAGAVAVAGEIQKKETAVAGDKADEVDEVLGEILGIIGG